MVARLLQRNQIAQQLRNWSKFNPVIRRCVNLIKDRLVRHEGRFVKKNIEDTTDYTAILDIFTRMLEKPNGNINLVRSVTYC